MAGHALLVHLKLRHGEFGSTEEREAIHELEDELSDAIADAGVGEFDGDDFGMGESILYMYGPDADKLFGVVQPLLQKSALSKGGYAIKRYGEAEDEDARELRVEL
jgi:hypothetical protein